MRVTFLLCAAAVSMAASSPESEATHSAPQSAMPVLGSLDVERDACDDLITQARQDSVLPKLDRQPATADKPYFIAAADQKIDGCSVMVMHNDKADFRPLPSSPDGPARLEPAR